MVGVGEGAAGDAPGHLPLKVFVVDQQAHQLGHRDCRVGVVELHRPVVGEVGDGETASIQVADHVLERATHEEVLLLQAQAAALVGAVIGIEHLG